MKKIIKLCFQTTIFILFITTAAVLITAKTDKVFGIQSFIVASGSMEPTLPVGSVVFTQKMASYNKGDVIAYKQGDVSVTHRIVKVTKNNGVPNFQTKGDANKTADQNKITSKEIIGKQFAFIPVLGKFMVFAKTLPGFIIFVILPALLFISFEMATVLRELDKRNFVLPDHIEDLKKINLYQYARYEGFFRNG